MTETGVSYWEKRIFSEGNCIYASQRQDLSVAKVKFKFCFFKEKTKTNRLEEAENLKTSICKIDMRPLGEFVPFFASNVETELKD